MSRIVNGEKTDGLRVECPHPTCDDEVPQSEWQIKEITDHYCTKGHCFRIEGVDEESLLFYRIDPTLAKRENLI